MPILNTRLNHQVASQVPSQLAADGSSTPVAGRAARVSARQARRLLCERLEPRFALHGMAWDFELLDQTQFSPVDLSASLSANLSANLSSGVTSYQLTSQAAELMLDDDCDDPLIGEGEAEPAASTGGVGEGFRPSGPREAARLPVDLVSGRPLGNAAAVDLRPEGGWRLDTQLPREGFSVINTAPAVRLPSSGLGNSPSPMAGVSLPLGSQYSSGTINSSGTITGNAQVTVAARPIGIGRADMAVTPIVASSSSIANNASRASVDSAGVSTFKQTTANYFDTRTLANNATSARTQADQLKSSRGSGDWTSADATSTTGSISELRSVVESLARQRGAERQAVTVRAHQLPSPSDMAADAIARAHRDVIHDDGLLQLATTPERMSSVNSLEAYAAMEQVADQSRSTQLLKVGMVREFELAGAHLGSLAVAADPAQLLAELPSEAVAAIDAWHANSVSAQDSLNTISDGENSVLNRSLLPLSFLAVGGLLFNSRRQHHKKRLRMLQGDA